MQESMNARWLRGLLSAIVLLLAVIAIELATLTGPMQPRAMAQIPDSGLQRKQMLEAQDHANLLLDAILQHLRTQTLKVKVVGTDKEARPVAPPVMEGVVPPAPRVIRSQ
jgi:hypothetical protein